MRIVVLAACLAILGCGAQPAPAPGKPAAVDPAARIDADDAAATRGWMLAEAKRLHELEKNDNPFQAKKEGEKTAAAFKALDGKEVSWDLWVMQVSEDIVNVGFHPDPKSPLVAFRLLKKGDNRFDVAGTYELKVGHELTPEQAANLKKGDRLKMKGMVSSAIFKPPVATPTFEITFASLKAE